jgi:hypothetical protein
MNYNFSLRPDDFREAWANAYQMAVLQTIEMHKRADDQLKVSYQLMRVTNEQSEKSRTRLLETAKVIEKNFEGVTFQLEKLINAATAKLQMQANRQIEEDTELRNQMKWFLVKLSRERTEFEKARALHFSQSLFRRLWNAIQNSHL